MLRLQQARREFLHGAEHTQPPPPPASPSSPQSCDTKLAIFASLALSSASPGSSPP